MKALMRVLFVEDSEDQVTLLAEHLRAHGFDPVYERVDTGPALAAALQRKIWDVVISDYSMPQFDGAAALKIFQESRLDIPFLCVSGSLGEEQAVAMMRAGAHDYIVKSNLSRLAPSVARELQAAQSRREHRRLQKSVAHLAAIVESSDDAIISKTLTGMITTWNKAAERIYGYSAEEMIGHNASILVPPGRQTEFVESLETIKRGHHVARFDTIRVRKDGTPAEVSITLSPIAGPSGEIIGASSIARDISDRRREEAERLKLIEELTDALAQAKTLRSLLPICASCKKIRDDHGYWQQLEVYFQQHEHIDFSHGVCPDCMQRLYPEFADEHRTAPAAKAPAARRESRA
jgi:two-component system, cell cycle sensor histidine kinase and response regulator CckA